MRANGRNIGRYNCQSISATFLSIGESADTVFLAKMAIFGQKKLLLAGISQFLSDGQSAETISLGQNSHFWPILAYTQAVL